MYTRNPMYLGLTLAYAGGSLVLGTWWAPVALPAVVAFIDRNVIRREEAYLRSRFGDEYEEFPAHEALGLSVSPVCGWPGSRGRARRARRPEGR